ncbi:MULTISPECIES: Lrp/AsnC family transcriptional regulator [Paenarthrobacter]|uniref:Lrp/AsnC family transcriptional regulator n=1 Tax=Paenarthrobacter TaxID=1742992 RepID=UPI00187809B3|nr:MULTISPECIES: Lrp/AsnC family transcriptional regulator [Paenarthrobacter]MEC3854146.1 Lrp/AsnC family transcriptional regulator [Paenarthrobacter ureafaciens]QOT18440.1 Lrp/AsnC family transcriptional regulator [Paenarthrobacter sp. YJN-5]
MSSHLDATDELILQILEDDARLPLEALALRAGLDANALSKRMENLQRSGHISAFTIVRAYPDSDAAPMSAIVIIRPDPQRNGQDLYRGLESIPEVVTAEKLDSDGSILIRLQIHDGDRLDAITARLRNQASVRSLEITTTTPLLTHLPWRPPIGS